MQRMLTFSVILLFLVVGIFFFMQNHSKTNTTKEIRYVALGDSYTIGEGASIAESWPTLLTQHLQKQNIQITLIANPSVTGWTTQQVIDQELPVYDQSNPTFATLLIGVNDWVQGVDKATFTKNLEYILDHMQAKLPDKSKLILITIPDFSITPTGKLYSNGRDIRQGITAFNDIIKIEGQKRNLPVVDIFALTQQMGTDSSLLAPDGLHPSAKEYADWEKLIFPVAYKMFK